MKNERKVNKGIYSLTLLPVICYLLFVMGCQDPVISGDNADVLPAGKGSFSLTVSADRTILPAALSLSDFVAYDLDFTATRGGTSRQVPLTNVTPGQSIPLDSGMYNLTVSAYKDAAKTQVAARGTLTGIIITAGQNTSATVTLQALLSGGTGTFRWSITLPTGATATMTITPVSTGGTAMQTITLAEADLAGSRTLNSGQYSVTFNLSMAAQAAVWKELLYVYQNLESVFTYTFTEGHFSDSAYTVTYQYNDGATANVPQSALYGERLRIPTAPTRTGYTFDGWYIDETTNNLYDFNRPVIDSFTLYAKWVINRYTVTFYANGGDPVPETQPDVVHGSKVDAPAGTMTRTGYTFGGWFGDAAFNTPWVFADRLVTSNTILYAKWIAEIYDVTFDADGGTPAPALQRVDHDGKVSEPLPMTRAGYIFIGWFKDVAFNTLWNFETNIVTGKTELYAYWIDLSDTNRDFFITREGTTFTIVNGNDKPIRTGTLQSVIDTLRAAANGDNLTITFGDGSVLDTGTVSLLFTNSSSSSWGEITLLGEITSANTNQGTIRVADTVSIINRADIANTGGYAVSVTSEDAEFILDDSSTITGRIRIAAKGKVSVAAPFTPTQIYTLEYADYDIGVDEVVVVGGTGSLPYFELYNKPIYILLIDDGSNLRVKDTYINPVVAHFNITGTGTRRYNGGQQSVTILPNNGNPGSRTIYYNGSTTAPTALGTYTVTFDVVGTPGYHAANGLQAGTMTIIKGYGATLATPSATNANIGLNSITLNTLTASTGQSVEYGINDNSSAPYFWQSSTTFTGLAGGTTYYFFARAVENANYEIGTASVTTISTKQRVGVTILDYWVDDIGKIVIGENSIPITGNSVMVLKGNNITFTADGSIYVNQIWTVNGANAGTGDTFTFTTADKISGRDYIVGLRVVKDGKPYFTEITVQVRN